MIPVNSLEKSEVWHSMYRGFTFEIRKWKHNYPESLLERYIRDPMYSTYNWNYYVYFNDRQIPKHLQREFILKGDLKQVNGHRPYYSYNEYNHTISRLEWHGGITFYKLSTNFHGNKVAQAGCDYSHSFDMEKREYVEYWLEDILCDVQGTIDSAHELSPDFGIFCLICGEYLPEREGKYINEHKSDFKCNNCIEKDMKKTESEVKE